MFHLACLINGFWNITSFKEISTPYWCCSNMAWSLYEISRSSAPPISTHKHSLLFPTEKWKIVPSSVICMILNQILHFPPQTCHSYTVFINLLTINFRAAFNSLSQFQINTFVLYNIACAIMLS